MKAAVCYEYGKPLVVEDVDIDPPKKGEVKVRMAATAVCHSDIHIIKGELPGGKLPLVAGHESAGYVEEICEGVTQVKVGDSVVVSLLTACGQCRYCTRGMPHLCEAKWPMNTESRLHNKKGQSMTHGTKTATFAEYAIVDQSQTVPIPKDMPMDAAALLACGVITGFGAVVNRARVRPGESAVVVGIGGVGINSIQGARFCGAYPIIAVDVLDNKLQMARNFGATNTINAKNTDPIKAVKEMTGGRGADFVFITVGSSEAVKQGISMCGPRGTTVCIGLPPVQQTMAISPHEFIRFEKTLTGSFMGTTRLKIEIPELVEFYKAGSLKLKELITAHYPLEKINEAIDAVVKGEALRNVIMFP
jgi:S-(hydroxymethyl)glutathione dehydrogenase / alcohol dehydrogenase